ncbi:MAG: tetratricopeptide repeat protein [Promethearchaeota archaeon]
MVNVGLMGASYEKITFLKIFAKYLNMHGSQRYTLVKMDFQGDRLLDSKLPQERERIPTTAPLGERETKTIHPMRIVFREVKTQKNHTIFAPGSEIDRAVVKMGTITISRISRVIIVIISVEDPIKEQLEFFEDLRFFPKDIYVWLIEREKILQNRDELFTQIKAEITAFFGRRKIKIRKFFPICLEYMLEDLNNQIVQSLLEVTTGLTEEIRPEASIQKSVSDEPAFFKVSFGLQKLFKETQDFTFLIGAGISRNPPSCLPSALEIVNGLLEHCAPHEEIKNLQNLRYELFVEYIQNFIDPNLKFLDYFDEAHPPNLLHLFLAYVLTQGHYVVTTNFDYLVEKALMQICSDHSKIVPVITQSDYTEYQPQELLAQGKYPLYKIHGSKNNIITGESTPGTLVTTISAFSKDKEHGKIFTIESYKRPVFLQLMEGRTIVVMGYSGSDDFDISPMLRLFPRLARLIWINHTSSQDFSITRVNTIADPRQIPSPTDRLLVEIANNAWYDIYRVEGDTSAILNTLWGQFFSSEKPSLPQPLNMNFKTWLSQHYSSIQEIEKYEWVLRFFINIEDYAQALRCAQQGLKLARETKDHNWEIVFLNQLGLVYDKQEKFIDALKTYEEVLRINTQRNNITEKTKDLTHIGIVYEHQREFNKALKYYEEALQINKQQNDLSSIARDYNNMGNIYRELGDLNKALSYYEEALRIDTQQNGLDGKARDLQNIGQIYEYTKEFDKAIEYYEEALTIKIQQGDLSQIAIILNELGSIHIKTRDLDNALQNYQQALRIAEQIGNARFENVVIENLKKCSEILFSK